MKYCVNCGKPMEDEAVVCKECGAVQSGSPKPQPGQPGYPYPGSPDGGNGSPKIADFCCQSGPQMPKTTPYLIWSIILAFICNPLGIAGIVFTALAANSHSYAQAQNNLKVSRICCIIGSCLAGAFILLYIVMIFIMVFIGLTTSVTVS